MSNNIMSNKRIVDLGWECFHSGGGCNHLYRGSADDEIFFLINKFSAEFEMPEDLEGQFATSIDVGYLDTRRGKRVLNFLAHEGFAVDHGQFATFYGPFEELVKKIEDAMEVFNNNEFYQ